MSLHFRPITDEGLKLEHKYAERLKRLAKEEVKLPQSSRGYFIVNNFYVSLKVHLFEQELSTSDGATLGYFCPITGTIFLNLSFLPFMQTAEIENLLRHELAHLLTYYWYQDACAHGPEFKKLCHTLGWGEEVSSATFPKEQWCRTLQTKITQDVQDQKKREKLEKLKALAQSSSEHEAHVAMSYAYKIAHELNVNVDENFSKIEHEYYSCVIWQGSRKTLEISTVISILDFFHVKTLTFSGPKKVALSLTGKKNDITFGLELFNYFRQTLTSWFALEKKLNPTLHKKSYFHGLVHGLSELQKKHYAQGKELIKLENELDHFFHLAYPQVTRRTSKEHYDGLSFIQGKLKAFSIELKDKIHSTQAQLT
jgi:predicted SprT family Zn-dependent metalloprotease